MTASRPIRLNAFDMGCVGHIQHGMWTHPRDHSSDYTSLDHWVRLAQMLERGLFDGLFLADVLGAYDVYGGNADAALRGSVQIPLLDPMALVPAMAYATAHLGFGVTCNLAYEAPFLFARRNGVIGSSDARPHRLEHRHRLSRQCGARDGLRCAGGT